MWMADIKKQAAKPLAERLSAAVFKALKGTRTGANVCRQELDIEENFVRNTQNQDFLFTSSVVHTLLFTHHMASTEPTQTYGRVTADPERERDHLTNLAVLEPVAKACKAPYVGDADAQFQAYLASCFSAYWAHMSDYTSQLRLGKSRILQRLAETTAEGNSLVHRRVRRDGLGRLYAQHQAIHRYPRATSTLREWLFPEKGCEYAIENSDAKEQERALQQSINGKALDAKKQRRLGTSQSQAQTQSSTRVPVLVVAIDESRALLEIKDSTGVDAFRLLRRALWAVNADERVKNVNGSVFAVLVDTKYLVDEAVPVSLPDPTSRRRGGTALFPPFILTQAMDVLLDNTSPPSQPPSKSRVLNTNPDQCGKLFMERVATLEGKQRELNKFAASKLLFGVDAKAAKSYEDRTLHGLNPPALESHILRQFEAILLNGVVDTGSIDQIVARIFLVLAIDATIMDSAVRKEFVVCPELCEKLVGAKPESGEDKSTTNSGAHESFSHWLSTWEDWKIGFSHFVNLREEPTEVTLWKMLDRRAADIFPRN
ncbi:hypothetical protein GQ600_3384 [Phytophthora cactorum]|nr:hypothetical protein GQ600_3384 [Phytophthora cactorum]